MALFFIIHRCILPEASGQLHLRVTPVVLRRKNKLINALGHHSGEVKHWVIMILVQMKERQAIPRLEKLLRESKDPSLVKSAKEAIRKICSQD